MKTHIIKKWHLYLKTLNNKLKQLISEPGMMGNVGQRHSIFSSFRRGFVFSCTARMQAGNLHDGNTNKHAADLTRSRTGLSWAGKRLRPANTKQRANSDLKERLLLSRGSGLGVKSLTWIRKLYVAADWTPKQKQTLNSLTNHTRIVLVNTEPTNESQDRTKPTEADSDTRLLF